MGQLVNRPMAMAATRCESHHPPMDKFREFSSANKQSGRAQRSPNWSRTDSQELRRGLLLSVTGAAAWGILFGLAHFVKLDSLLGVSQAIYNLISGVSIIAKGLMRMTLGVVQMLGFAALAVVAVTAVFSLVSGAVRIGWKLLPQLESTWELLANGLNGITDLLILPLGRPKATRQANSRRAASNQKAA
ncbi:MAG: hypothetical protein ACI9IO_001300 [Cyanobium sp.]|jgi:hypothetical protein